MALPVCSKKTNRLQFSLTFRLSAENIFCLRYIISQFSCLALQKYSLIIGYIAITSSNIMSFFISFGISSGLGNSFTSLKTQYLYTLNHYIDYQ